MGEEKREQSPALMDHEKIRIDQFGEVLRDLVGIKPIPDSFKFDSEHDNPVETAVKNFKDLELPTKKTLYLHNEFFPQQIDTPAITIEPLVARGGKNSKHGVFFGGLNMGENVVIEVAVKPHITAVRSMQESDATYSAVKDYANNKIVHELGFDGLQPVGFLLDSLNRAYSFTKLDESITTLDSIDWTNFYPDIHLNPVMHNYWRRISQQAAYLHSIGSSQHGDLAPRNIAVSSVPVADEAIFFIDWEDANINLLNPRDAEVAYGHSYTDLSVILESMCRPPHASFKPGIGIFYNKNDDWWEGFKQIFLDEYCNFRIELATQGNHSSSKINNVKEELVELQRTLQQDIEMYKEICQDL